MNFIHLSYLPGLALAFAVLVLTIVLLEKRFFSMVQRYWFHKRSLFSYLSTFFFLLGMGVLLVSLLDLRGPEEKVKTPVPQQKTIILLDTSASMLAEDIKPSRLQKATLIAKHFARKAAGQQISIVAFAEIQKKIVPFTTDLDLLDARLDSLKTLRNQYGSSALTVAIQESIQYFLESGEDVRGNILVITDGEETAEGIKLQIPKDIKVALVGIGTEQGGRIPLDDGRGFRYGYKKVSGQDIITKLNEKFFRSTASDIPNAKYWIANSYSLPSEEIIDFFKSQNQKGDAEQDMIMRPVLAEWLLIPAIVSLILSYFFKSIKIFAMLALLGLTPVYSAEENTPQLSEELQARLQQLGSGDLNKLERVKLADDLYKAGAKAEALSLYEESLPLPKLDPSIPPEAYLNYGTALIENKEEIKGLSVYQSLKESLPDADPKTQELRDMMDKNVVTHFKIQEQKKQQQKKEQQKKDKENKEQQGQGQDNQNQPGQDQKKEQQGKSGQQDQQKKDSQGKDPKDQEKDKKDQEEKGKEGEEKKDDPKDGEQKDKDQKEGPGEEQKAKARKKVDPKLRQLMDDDRQLQMKFIENGTRDLNRRNSRKSKDW